jgi:hypothetical protein
MRKALLASLALCAACSIDRAALRSTARILENSRATVHEEPDYQLAREASAAQLKLIESLLASDPDNRGLRLLAAEGFGGAAFLFLEDENPARAKGFYRRGRDHALAALARDPGLKGLADMPLEPFEAAVKKAGKPVLPDLYWAAFNWAGLVNLSKDDASALADLPKAVALMRRVYELDPTYQFGGADLFFGVYYASRPPLLGGDPQKAKTHFEWAHRITKGKFLMAHYLNARWYAVAVQDRELFKQLLEKVASEPAGALPLGRLTDEAAKRKAAALLEKIDDYF